MWGDLSVFFGCYYNELFQRLLQEDIQIYLLLEKHPDTEFPRVLKGSLLHFKRKSFAIPLPTAHTHLFSVQIVVQEAVTEGFESPSPTPEAAKPAL